MDDDSSRAWLTSGDVVKGIRDAVNTSEEFIIVDV